MPNFERYERKHVGCGYFTRHTHKAKTDKQSWVSKRRRRTQNKESKEQTNTWGWYLMGDTNWRTLRGRDPRCRSRDAHMQQQRKQHTQTTTSRRAVRPKTNRTTHTWKAQKHAEGKHTLTFHTNTIPHNSTQTHKTTEAVSFPSWYCSLTVSASASNECPDTLESP